MKGGPLLLLVRLQLNEDVCEEVCKVVKSKIKQFVVRKPMRV